MAAVWDDLQCGGLGIYREPGAFSYGQDAVLLSDFARARASDRLLDIGTGTGVLPFLIHAKTGASFTAVELDPACAALAQAGALRNGLADKVRVVQGDLRALTQAEHGMFDGAVCNPPYHRAGKHQSPGESRARSAFQTACTLEDVVACAGRMLKNGGLFFLCYPAEGLGTLCAALCGHKLEPKRICLVRSKAEKPPYLLLVEARKGGRPGVRLTELTVLYDGEGA